MTITMATNVIIVTAITVVTLMPTLGYDIQDLPLSPRQVQTKYGTLRGVIIPLRSPGSSGSSATGAGGSPPMASLSPVEAFVGVPYAAPPVKTLRFMPPVTLSKWRGVRLATRYSASCIQRVPDVKNVTEALRTLSATRVEYIRRLQPFVANQSEDCLYLNVYVPHNPTAGSQSSSSTSSSPPASDTSSSSGGRYVNKYPVIVFIGGESYEWAVGNSYDGSLLASYGQVIVITINYRLGVWGFLPSILEGSVRGNYGLMDQVAALHWIQENIQEFYGDNNNVTIIGHGYGAACAHLLMLSPMATGLFARVVLMSGSALSPWAIARNADIYSIKLAQELNCPIYDNIVMVDCIRHKTVEEIQAVPLEAPQYLTSFGPIIDGILVPSEPKHILETGLSDFNYHFQHNVSGHGVGASGATAGAATAPQPVPAPQTQPPLTPLLSQSVHYINNYDLLFGVTRVEAPYVFGAHEERHGIDPSKRDRILRTLVRNLFDFQQQSIFLTLMNEYTDWNRPVDHPINLLDSTVDILGDALRVSSLIESGDLHSKWISSQPTPQHPSQYNHHYHQSSQQPSQPYISFNGGNGADGANGALPGGPGVAGGGRNARIYFYVFAYQSEDGNKLLHQRLGCMHGEELAYLFGAPLAVQLLGRPVGHFAANYSKPEVTLSEAVMTYWTNFAKYGDPNVWPHEFETHGDRTKGRFESVVWPQYDSTQKKYLMIGMKPKVRDHYHSHRLSFWLHLIPKLHRPGGDEDLYLRHHLLLDHDNQQSYDGIVRQIAFKFLEPLPTAPGIGTKPNQTHQSTGGGNNLTKYQSKGLNYKSQLQQQHLSTARPHMDSPDGTGVSTDRPTGSLASNKTTATAIVMNDGTGYTTALTITIAIGCSLLFLNIIIFAGIYYQLNSSKTRRKQKKFIKTFECPSPPDNGLVLSSTTSGTLRTNSRSPPLSLSPIRGNHSICTADDELLMDQTMIDHCVDHRCADTGTTTAIVTCAVCPPSLTTSTSTNTKGILKYNKSPNSHTMGSTAATMGRVKCPQKCCVSCRYVTNPRVPELRYDSIGIDREEPDITHEYSHT